jgi:hypothetical protein
LGKLSEIKTREIYCLSNIHLPAVFELIISIAFSSNSSFPFFIPSIVGLTVMSILIPFLCVSELSWS